MGDSARRAVAIEAELRRRPADELPPLADVEDALIALRELTVDDAADALVVRDTIAGLIQLRNAAKIAERSRP